MKFWPNVFLRRASCSFFPSFSCFFPHTLCNGLKTDVVVFCIYQQLPCTCFKVCLFVCAVSTMLVYSSHTSAELSTSQRCKIMCRVIFTIPLVQRHSRVSDDYYTCWRQHCTAEISMSRCWWITVSWQPDSPIISLSASKYGSLHCSWEAGYRITLTSITKKPLGGSFYAVLMPFIIRYPVLC